MKEKSLQSDILDVLNDEGPCRPALIREALDGEQSRQLIHYHLRELVDAGKAEQPHHGIYDVGDNDD